MAHQTPLPIGFPRQEYWSGLPFPSLESLPDPGIELRSPALQADSLLTEPLTPVCNIQFLMKEFYEQKEVDTGSYTTKRQICCGEGSFL